jgi:hypothetical protein
MAGCCEHDDVREVSYMLRHLRSFCLRPWRISERYVHVKAVWRLTPSLRHCDWAIIVGTETGLQTRRKRSRSSNAGSSDRFFCSPLRQDRLWVALSLPYNMCQLLFPFGVKRPGREAGHSPPSSAEVKIVWSYTSTTHTFSWHAT